MKSQGDICPERPGDIAGSRRDVSPAMRRVIQVTIEALATPDPAEKQAEISYYVRRRHDNEENSHFEHVGSYFVFLFGC